MKRLSLGIIHVACSAALLTLTVSCLEEKDPYNAGFVFRKPTSVYNMLYANNQVDTISFMSYGRWSVNSSTNMGGNWCNFEYTSGHGSTLYTFPIHFQQNNTGIGRGVQLNFADTDHPGDASALVIFWQSATRGDGTLGNAPDVKTITGSDGSHFEFTYDDQHRPLSLRITKDEALVRSLSLRYNDNDSTLTVQDMTKTLTGSYSKDYQPVRLIGSSDTVGYYSQYYSNGMPVSMVYAFNLEHHSYNGDNTYYAFKLGGQSLSADSLHCADSLRIAVTTKETTQVTKMKLNYSKNDNRCQSVDVNQLVFGTEQCDPYQLLSLFRVARNTSIVSSIESDKGKCDVEVSLNADKSVAQLTVNRSGSILGNEASSQEPSVTYTFEY